MNRRFSPGDWVFWGAASALIRAHEPQIRGLVLSVIYPDHYVVHFYWKQSFTGVWVAAQGIYHAAKLVPAKDLI